MRIRETGEFKLLRRIRQRLHAESRLEKKILVGIGDDAFAADQAAGKALVVTNDLLVEDTHFRKIWITPSQLGYKAMAVNLSDLAAMGGAKPLYAFVGLALPGDISVDIVDKLYAGMNRACSKFKFMIAGGDTVDSKKGIVISITLFGEISPKRLLTRSCAKPGDLVYVTGCFGDSAAGLRILEKKGSKPLRGAEKELVEKHLVPEPRMEAAGRLSATGAVTSMIDSSDGLAASLKFISEESGVGADIQAENIPLSGALRSFCSKAGKLDPTEFALNGGEDYELVFTVRPEGAGAAERAVKGVRRIGVITPGRRVRYFRNGTPAYGSAAGYEAFAAGGRGGKK